MCLSNILSPVIMFAFVFHCRSFSPCWPLAFLIVSQLLWIFMFFFLQNSSLLFSTTRSCSFFQITSMLLFFLSKSPGGYAIFSKQNLELHLGFHTLVPEVFLDFSLRKRWRASREAATTSWESDEEREKNLWLPWPQIWLSCRRQLSNASNC